MDRFDAMRAFVQVVESGSYTKAALQLNLHKATVSQQIQQLEERLGSRLLTRTTRSVTPTEEGLAYYPHACAILQQVDELESQHVSGAETLQKLRSALGIAAESRDIRPFASLLADYAESQWQHMRMEEEQVLPLAKQHLTAEDWLETDAAFAANREMQW